MKKFTSIILCAVFLLTFCSCGTTEQQPGETRIDNYTYEQEKNIENAIKGEMSQYGFNYSIFAHENSSGVIDISLTLHRASTGADEAFADTVCWCVAAAKKAKEETPFELGELRASFLLYDGPLDGEAVGTMSYTSKDLEKGNVFCTGENFDSVRTKTGATAEEIKEWLANE